MKKIFLSLASLAVILLVLGCSKNLPSDPTEGEGTSRSGKDITIVFSGETVDSPRFGSNIASDWDLVDMTIKSETSAEVTVKAVAGKTYRVNVEFSPDNWVADEAGTHGKITANGTELTNIEDNGLGGKNFLLSVE